MVKKRKYFNVLSKFRILWLGWSYSYFGIYVVYGLWDGQDRWQRKVLGDRRYVIMKVWIEGMNFGLWEFVKFVREFGKM